ncbi:MAG: AMP-binding protein [Candidatus Abyssubacteria bacterium]|nr:AMP-binding protein [Candidatus Abyssubacteria bacterium]
MPVGVPGELYLGGDGLALGYLNRPDLTDEKFVPDPFGGGSEACLYRTGDRTRYLPDGNIEFMGRIDYQVKIRGFRVEPEEVEIILRQISAIHETVVLAREDEPGNRYLAAYIVPEADQAPTVAEIRNFLKQKLPDYMVPSSFVMMEAFPLTPNGKVNRHSLPVPASNLPELGRELLEPRDSLELRIVKLLETLLNIHPIGISDNFFDLGGHSLMAARLFSQIEKMTGKALPLGTLFEAPTVEQISNILRSEGWAPRWQSLVPIQHGDGRRPLFCIHPKSGNILGYADLLRHLDPEQPVYGLQSLGLDGKQPPLRRVEDMAALYIEEIQSVAPKGPYQILGRCAVGGVVAFEMAQQLVAQGQEVALLAMIDADNAIPLRPPGSRNPLRRRSLIRYPRRNIKRIARKISFLFDSPQARRFESVQDVNFRAWEDYMPKIFPGRIVLFCAEGRLRIDRPEHDPRTPGGWEELAEGGLEFHVVSGNHLTMLQGPLVEVVAEKLRAHLDKAYRNEQNSV